MEMLLTWDIIPSLNSAHKANRHGGIYLTPTVRNYKQSVMQQIAQVPAVKEFKHKNGDFYKLTIQFYFRRNFGKRDLDNCIKYTQDGLAETLGINDATIVELNAKKSIVAKAKKEYIHIIFEKSDFEVDSRKAFDQLNHQEDEEIKEVKDDGGTSNE